MPVDSEHTSGKKLPGEVREYVEKRIQLAALTISEKISKVISNSFQKVAGIILLAGGFLFAWFALCYFLGDLVNNTSLGFLLGSLPLLVLGIVLYKAKFKSLSEKIQADVITGILQKIDPETRKEKNKGGSSE